MSDHQINEKILKDVTAGADSQLIIPGAEEAVEAARPLLKLGEIVIKVSRIEKDSFWPNTWNYFFEGEYLGSPVPIVMSWHADDSRWTRYNQA